MLEMLNYTYNFGFDCFNSIEDTFQFIKSIYVKRLEEYDNFFKFSGLCVENYTYQYFTSDENQDFLSKLLKISDGTRIRNVRQVLMDTFGIDILDDLQDNDFGWLSCETYEEYLEWCAKKGDYPFFIHDYKNKIFNPMDDNLYKILNSIEDTYLENMYFQGINYNYLLDNTFIDAMWFCPCFYDLMETRHYEKDKNVLESSIKEFVSEDYKCPIPLEDDLSVRERCRYNKDLDGCMLFRKEYSLNNLKNTQFFERILGKICVTSLSTKMLHSVAEQLAKKSVVHEWNM